MSNSSMHLKKDSVTAIAIGGFDGVHLGHQQLIARLGEHGALLVIDKDEANLTPGTKRSQYAKYPCMFYHFLKVKDLSGEEFIALLKKEFPNLRKIVVGYDFCFGAKRAHRANDLPLLFDGEVEIVKEFLFEGISVHSSTIRTQLREGNIALANRLLGREYGIVGTVIAGQGLGKKVLYPTLNLHVKHYLLPKEGVYATRTLVEGRLVDSVSFVGVRTSTDGKFAIETHLLEAPEAESVYHVELFFVAHLRENQTFSDLKLLKKQIEKDIIQAREALHVKG
ncbi:bifunctional riboflavin kinase/FAD synthetase [Sulfurospirillum sp. T05]|uniref:Riboflavin biosynthesis protein n=1 Tax=Sulfurospirillum tamanense TaxID=2813362 RepID=A0ABS2WQ06_9BACT|nr:bifunctional riboflavin kinase/FAD synthetase [Sulfurospirillum tamanensis]MBN2963777.1 bifunctional riboflavin kinase/FAD synthetase [Sulfurospirillum tamanensis]